MEFTWWQNHHALSKPVRSYFFKKEVWHLTGKTLPNSNALPPFSRKLTKLT